MSDSEALLTEAQAAEFIRLSPRYLQQRRYSGGGPEYVRISHRCVRYSPGALRAWLASRSFRSTCEERVQSGNEAA